MTWNGEGGEPAPLRLARKLRRLSQELTRAMAAMADGADRGKKGGGALQTRGGPDFLSQCR